MLKSLYNYAVRNELMLPPGYVNKTVKVYVVLSSKNTDYIDLLVSDGKPIPVPDIGSLANGIDKSNVLLEKRSIVFPEDSNAKSIFFLKALYDAAEYEPLLEPCIRVIETPEKAEKVRQLLDREKIKPEDRICFQVDHINILESEAIRSWWEEYRKKFMTGNKEKLERCLITGKLTIPLRTAGVVSGLKEVGGHPRGDAIICFDKASFESYGLKQAANAPVSDEAMSAVNTALTELIKKAPVLAGMKVVHWYDCDVPIQEDPFPILIDTAFETDESEDEEENNDEKAEIKEKALNAELKFRALIKAIETGASVAKLDAQYHILMLSGATGRVIVRRYERGTYGELVSALKQWEEELCLTNSNETGNLPAYKMKARFIRLLNYNKEDRKNLKKLYQRMDKELSALVPVVLHSILNGKAPLPDSLAARALNYIRSCMMSAQEDDIQRERVDPIAEQWLKVWLIRSRNKGGKIMSTYNSEYYEVPYCIGAMVAVYGAIQKAAMPDVNASVIDRYYGSAIQTPGLVMGTLSQRAENHLRNLDDFYYNYYKNLLAELGACMAGQHYPVTLNLEQQSEFSLGYYQMIARLKKEKRERIEAWKAKKEAAEK